MRRVSWQGTSVALSSIDLAAGTAAMVTALSPGTLPSVCLRTHGELLFQLDTGGVDERVVVAYGLIVASENALGVGVTAVPTPFTDAEDDWYVHGYATMTSLAEAAVATDGIFHRITVDSKGMRKLKPTEGVAFVVEVAAVLNVTGTFDVIGAFRTLQSAT